MGLSTRPREKTAASKLKSNIDLPQRMRSTSNFCEELATREIVIIIL